MDNAQPDGAPAITNVHLVEVKCSLGTMNWRITPEVYAILPRDKRDGLLDIIGERQLVPFFDDMTHKLLRQAGVHGIATQSLDASWCFMTRDLTCCFGELNWMIGQGLWEKLPEDQRDTLLEVAMAQTHDFLKYRILQTLINGAIQNFGR